MLFLIPPSEPPYVLHWNAVEGRRKILGDFAVRPINLWKARNGSDMDPQGKGKLRFREKVLEKNNLGNRAAR